ncbi:MAG TPA: anti-sigma factor [Macromonas sp.]|nr:anti-sigma factor [Macromonas sp.]
MSDTTCPASPPSPAAPSRRVSPWWRALAVALLLALLIGVAASVSMFEQLRLQIRHLQGQLAQQPQVRHVAVLLDQQQQAAMLVTFDPTTTELQLQRLNAVREGREDTMQLWALRAEQAPRSLGIITSKLATLQIPTSAEALDGVTQLAISVENKGGVPEAQGPRLPYLFSGWLVQKAL